MGFADSVAKTATKMQEQVNAKAVEISTTLFTVLVSKTPIADGRYGLPGTLVNNWFVGYGVGAYNKSFIPSPNPSANNSYSQIATIRNSKEFLSKDGEISLTNSTPYAYRAEILGWPAPLWSGRYGPYAMVRNTLTTVAPLFKK